jgi:hypothetical protein
MRTPMATLEAVLRRAVRPATAAIIVCSLVHPAIGRATTIHVTTRTHVVADDGRCSPTNCLGAGGSGCPERPWNPRSRRDAEWLQRCGACWSLVRARS